MPQQGHQRLRVPRLVQPAGHRRPQFREQERVHLGLDTAARQGAGGGVHVPRPGLEQSGVRAPAPGADIGRQEG